MTSHFSQAHRSLSLPAFALKKQETQIVASEHKQGNFGVPSEEHINFNDPPDKSRKVPFFDRKILTLKTLKSMGSLQNNRLIEEKKEAEKAMKMGTLFGIKDIRKILGTKENEGILIPLLRKFIYKLKKNTLFFKYKQLNDCSLSMINDVVVTHGNIEGKYAKENAEKSFFSRFLDKKAFEFWAGLPIINPHDNLKISWDIIHLILTLFLFFWIPIDVCFVVNMPPDLSLFFSLFFLFDICLNLNTAYFQNGYIVVKRKKILKNYVSKYFLMDVISSVVYIVDLFVVENTMLNNVELIKFFLFIRLGSLSLIYEKLLEKFKVRLKIHNSFIDLINLLFYSLLIIHVFACFWNFLGEHFMSQGNISWLEFNNLSDASIKTKYVYSLYWSAVTVMTVGYGDVTAHNKYEQIYSIFTIVIGCGVFAYIINTIGFIVGDITKENQVFKHNLNIITHYMERKKVNYNLQMKIREYLRFIWKEEFTQNAEMEEIIINKLSKSLKEELFLEANGKILNEYPMFFANFSEGFLRQLMYKMKEVRHTPEDLIFQEGKYDDAEIFFVMKGKVRIFMNDNKNNEESIILKDLKEGDCFGEISFFTGNSRSASAQSKDFTTLCSLKRADFLETLNKNPEDYEKYCAVIDQIKFDCNFNALSIKCFSCEQKGHLAFNCPLIHYIPDVEKMIKVYTFNPGQKERLEVIRNPVKSMNALGSKSEINYAFQRFQRLLRQLYEMENDTFMINDDTDRNSDHWNESKEGTNEVSAIEVNSSEAKSHFNISLLKTQSLNIYQGYKQDPSFKLQLKEVGESLSPSQELDDQAQPQDCLQTPSVAPNGMIASLLMEDKPKPKSILINEEFQTLKEMDHLLGKSGSSAESLRFHSDHSSPSHKKFDLTINTASSKSSAIKNSSPSRKKLSSDPRLHDIPEVNSQVYSSPEKHQILSQHDEDYEFLHEHDDPASLEFPEIQFDPQIFESRGEEENRSPRKIENIWPLYSNENEESEKKGSLNAISEDRFENSPNSLSPSNREDINPEKLDKFTRQKSKKSIDVTNNEETNHRLELRTPPSSVKIGDSKKSLFAVPKKKTKNNYNISNLGPSPLTGRKRKKSVHELINSPLLKLPIYNLESPGLIKNKSGEISKKKLTEEIVPTNNDEQHINEKANEESAVLNEDNEFDRVSHFKNYHPENNVKNLIKKMAKAKKKKTEDEYKRHQKGRGITKSFKRYFEKTVLDTQTEQTEKPEKTNPNRIKANQVIPLASPNNSALKRASEGKNNIERKSSPEMQNKRPSSIFTSSIRYKNFFQHDNNEVSFYDVVYEVLTNKELRKKLQAEKAKSKKKKSSRKVHDIN